MTADITDGVAAGVVAGIAVDVAVDIAVDVTADIAVDVDISTYISIYISNYCWREMDVGGKWMLEGNGCWRKMDVAPSTNGKPLICGTLTQRGYSQPPPNARHSLMQGQNLVIRIF